TLRSLQEKKGYFFNKDETMTMPLLEQLLVTKARYGYMACPCRFANGQYEKDKDIICPCTYREADIAEYDACYCGLYVSEACYKGECEAKLVPERRPPENIIL
ncbi:ferredoxin:thioredoxin reductase, partial [Desulfovibrio sp. OttesenSCG-928-O18]|nr:ferredoxin:thioredoxin reductase [Desulfovibrio sp. OttesenSCG-928-O18]